MDITQIIQRLKDGNQRFVNSKLQGEGQDAARRKELTGGQAPYAIVLSCADSRVIPELAFDTGLGELFVVRVAGNIANASSIGSIEYAVAHCGVKVIIVLGHQSCGAVTAAVQGDDNGPNINHLVDHITPAIKACPTDASITAVIKKNATYNAQALIDKSNIIAKAIETAGVRILPAYYSLDSGEVDFI